MVPALALESRRAGGADIGGERGFGYPLIGAGKVTSTLPPLGQQQLMHAVSKVRRMQPR